MRLRLTLLLLLLLLLLASCSQNGNCNRAYVISHVEETPTQAVPEEPSED